MARVCVQSPLTTTWTSASGSGTLHRRSHVYNNMATRLEINFCRLLNRCEVIASDKALYDWRLEKVKGILLHLSAKFHGFWWNFSQ